MKVFWFTDAACSILNTSRPSFFAISIFSLFFWLYKLYLCIPKLKVEPPSHFFDPLAPLNPTFHFPVFCPHFHRFKHSKFILSRSIIPFCMYFIGPNRPHSEVITVTHSRYIIFLILFFAVGCNLFLFQGWLDSLQAGRKHRFWCLHVDSIIYYCFLRTYPMAAAVKKRFNHYNLYEVQLPSQVLQQI